MRISTFSVMVATLTTSLMHLPTWISIQRLPASTACKQASTTVPRCWLPLELLSCLLLRIPPRSRSVEYSRASTSYEDRLERLEDKSTTTGIRSFCIQAATCAAQSLSGISGVLYHLRNMCHYPNSSNHAPTKSSMHPRTLSILSICRTTRRLVYVWLLPAPVIGCKAAGF